ncbi:MAG: hypothetical protein LAN62_05940 [Acidobacteriia bacterium]|nr:hypothetical protein [Terriglobia bacterium]
MEEVGKILPGVFKRHLRPSDPAYVDVLASLWPRLVGKAIAAQSWPVAFELLPAEGQVGAARLEPELSGVLQRSYSKYFSRPDRKVH